MSLRICGLCVIIIKTRGGNMYKSDEEDPISSAYERSEELEPVEERQAKKRECVHYSDDDLAFIANLVMCGANLEFGLTIEEFLGADPDNDCTLARSVVSYILFHRFKLSRNVIRLKLRL